MVRLGNARYIPLKASARRSSTSAVKAAPLDSAAPHNAARTRTLNIESVPSLHEFMAGDNARRPAPVPPPMDTPVIGKVYLETYGCQQNEGDSEIVLAVLAKDGYVQTQDLADADVILTNTCAIRDNAEKKVWQRLGVFRAAASATKERRDKARMHHEQMARVALEEEANELASLPPISRPIVGLLGCMAERLKGKVLDQNPDVDLVVGPDRYRNLPALIKTTVEARKQEEQEAAARRAAASAARNKGNSAVVPVPVSASTVDQRTDKPKRGLVDTAFSYEETYADIIPLRNPAPSPNSGTASGDKRVSAYLSIQRGCNSNCSYCIVPFTRGREKSVPVASLEDQVRRLRDEGYREVTLLGQTVNTYYDPTTPSIIPKYAAFEGKYQATPGFSNMYKLRDGAGVRFTELLDRLTSDVAPDMRFRFTSPHPKDFPEELIQLIAERPNLCKQVHLPAQSGSNRVLQAMRRGYSREAYLALAHRLRATIPGLALSTDIIAGFCSETEEEHLETLSLMREVRYEGAFLFAYSLRERTHAAYHLKDDVPEAVKKRRLSEVIAAYHAGAIERNRDEVAAGRLHVVLVEDTARRSDSAAPTLRGKTDSFKTVVLGDLREDAGGIPSTGNDDADATVRMMADEVQALLNNSSNSFKARKTRKLSPGDFVIARVTGASAMSLKATPLVHLGSGLLDPAVALMPPPPLLK